MLLWFMDDCVSMVVSVARYRCGIVDESFLCWWFGEGGR